ncbi:MAG: hypothetical protein IJW55_05355 [Clostridia bacterium]|nr:hypothetical protein [Clostridia bacterium]
MMIEPNNALHTVMMQNDIITYAYSRYLNHTPRFLTPEMVESLAKDCNIDTDEAFLSLFGAACGLEPDINPTHRTLERQYLRTGVRRLDPTVFQKDEYYCTVKFPNIKSGRWELKQSFYAPYEPFVCDHPKLTGEFREVPQIGYFKEQFDFPAILENGIEWMTVTPNEIATMREPIAKSRGCVLTLGLGLGYFAFCASQKKEVESVTVVERDGEVIDLFRRYLLPQFPNAEKIELIQADAFAYLEEHASNRRWDYIFADLWHDQSDGLPMYLKLRRIEKQTDFSHIDYWIEPSLLSSLRRMVWDKLTDRDAPMKLQGVSPKEFLSDNFLRRLAPDIKPIEN